jgi:hypothetical protein
MTNCNCFLTTGHIPALHIVTGHCGLEDKTLHQKLAKAITHQCPDKSACMGKTVQDPGINQGEVYSGHIGPVSATVWVSASTFMHGTPPSRAPTCTLQPLARPVSLRRMLPDTRLETALSGLRMCLGAPFND